MATDTLRWILLLNLGILCLFLGLTTESRTLRRFLFLPLIILLLGLVGFQDAYDIRLTPLDRLRASSAAGNLLLRAVELLLCTKDPHIEFVRDVDRKKGIKISKEPFRSRFAWAVSLCCSQRGAGWNWRVAWTPVSPMPLPSRSRYLLTSILRLVIVYLSIEMMSLVFAHIGLHNTTRVPTVLLHGILIFLAIHLTYISGCIVWLVLGLGGPEDCPPLFGDWRHARTLRGFWGRAWHQWFRQSLTVISDAIFQVFGIRHDTIGIGPFFLIGFYHAMGVHAMSRGELGIKTILFFSLQSLGLFIEDRILRIHAWAPLPQTQETVSATPEGIDPHTNSDSIEIKGGAVNDPSSGTLRKNGHVSNGAYKVNRSVETPAYRLVLAHAWVLGWLICTSSLYFDDMLASGLYAGAEWGGHGWLPVPIIRWFIV